MPRSEPRKLTEAAIKSMPVGTPILIRDTKVTGLMVAVNKHSKSYKVQRDLWHGQRGRREDGGDDRGGEDKAPKAALWGAEVRQRFHGLRMCLGLIDGERRRWQRRLTMQMYRGLPTDRAS